MNEIEKLLNELKSMNTGSSDNSIKNTKDLWSRIGGGEHFSSLGFSSQKELDKFIADNPYSNL
jgi:hypothetical protein